MLEHIFLEVLKMSFSASIVIVIVVVIRRLIKKFPKFISYMLWSVVFFRLLCPFKIETAASPVPNFEYAFQEVSYENNQIVLNGELSETIDINVKEKSDATQSAMSSPTEQPIQTTLSEIAKPKTKQYKATMVAIGKYIWSFGLMILLIYCLVSLLMIRKKVATAMHLKENIYGTDKMLSPFVLGLFRPQIYLPTGLGRREQEYVIFHERSHIKHFDHIIKLLGFLAACIHWFNPFAWIAFKLFCNDMEMCCDETVIREMGDDVKADYSATLLLVSTNRQFLKGIPVDFGEGNIKERIKNISGFSRPRKGVLAVLVASIIVLILCLASTQKVTLANEEPAELEEDDYSVIEIASTSESPSDTIPEQTVTIEPMNVTVAIEELYCRCIGNPGNFYRIDDNGVLWGSGRNQCGQLGQGTQDTKFYQDMVKIAENVIDVDYSQKGFVIFLTEDHKLYGIGNCGSGALLQYDSFDWTKFVNEDKYCISEPCLLMEGVKYACCGRDDIVCMTEDDVVWTWGCVFASGGRFAQNTGYLASPTKILENAAVVTGGWFNHAALLKDGTVWTWGYNTSGNCGVADALAISEPIMVADGVTMVWTDRAVESYPQPSMDDIIKAWTGKRTYNMERADISEFGLYYPQLLCNTVIRKVDGSYWVCGENVGTEVKIVQGAEGEYPVIWSEKFQQYK